MHLCKKDFDKMTIPVPKYISIKNNDKDDKIRNIKFKESEEYGFYTIEFHGQLTDELDIPYLEWIKIYD